MSRSTPDLPGTPGTPSLLRAINDRAALRVLLERGPLTRPELAGLIGISKPTASQLLSRLADAGLVILDGIREGLPGRTAEVYRINPSAAHVAGLDVTPQRIAVTLADLVGCPVGEYRLQTPGRSGGDVVERVRAALRGACEVAGIGPDALRRVVIGIQGAVDPGTGRLGYAAHIPGWHIPRLVDTLRAGLGTGVDVENDVNLVALAEQARGTAHGHRDFALLWVSDGVGMALVLGGRLHRGSTGGAGEIGYMPVPGAPGARDAGRHATHGMQALVGGPTVLKVMRSYGYRGSDPAAAVRTAVTAAEKADHSAHAALRDLAGRLATGLAPVTAIVDPEIIVLTGDILLAGGETLRGLVELELHALTIPRPRLVLSTVEGNPVLTGALDLALTTVRDEVFGSTVS
ncbi:ROK family transcriptional regulator [Rhizohabitans arisaemae]|uniref:ROK family transcriptional regulator n=1 Tax=Rhizohabitans arisaemae TaxID=2720610 RepID=UPI0024B26351|nr:ROK family transcriptional regulator [Rhizohabitans arisaemae]